MLWHAKFSIACSFELRLLFHIAKVSQCTSQQLKNLHMHAVMSQVQPCQAGSSARSITIGPDVYLLNCPQELIGTLEEAKSKAVEISQKLAEASTTASQIEDVRAKYKPAALRGAVLFFVLASLAAISNMYEYSLASFLAVFSLTLDTSKKVQSCCTCFALRWGYAAKKGRAHCICFAFTIGNLIKKQLDTL